MHKILIIGIASLFLFSSTHGQNQPERAAEATGNQLMKDARQHIKSFRSLKIFFTYNLENSSKNLRESVKGELISQGDRYHMSLSGNLFVSDGVNTWTYLKEMNEVYINTLANSEGGLTPTSILNDFETQFRAKHIRRESHQGRSVEIIDLVPRTPQVFFKFRVALDATTKMLVYTIAYDREGGTYTYTIDRVETNPAITPQQFTFNAANFPGIEVVDLR